MTGAGRARQADAPGGAHPPRLTEKTFRRSIDALIALAALAHLYAAFHPTVFNWGFHHLAFGPPVLRWLVPAVMLVAAFNRVQDAGVRLVRRCAAGFLSLTESLRRLVLSAGFALIAAGFYAFRSAGILGDGLYLVNQMSLVRKPGDVVHVFIHEPLTGLITWLAAKHVFGDTGPAGAEAAYRAVSLACGALFLPLLLAVVRRVVPGRTGRILSFLFVLSAGSSLLYFGYIENYTIAFLALLFFVYLCLRHEPGRRTLVLAAAAAGTLIPLYFGMIVFLPVLAWLLVRDYLATRRPAIPAVSAAVFLAVCFGLLAVTGYTPARFLDMLTGGGQHTVGLFASAPDMPGYTMLSPLHLADLANFVLLVSPSALFLIALTAGAARNAARSSALPLLLLFSALGGLLAFTFRCDLGMPRDWDLLAPFMLGTLLLAAALAARGSPGGPRRHAALFAVTALGALHSVPWVMLNHSPAMGVAQFRMVLEQTTWIEKIHVGYEALAMGAKRRGDYATAAEIYREYIARDPTHARILGNLADVYRVLGIEDSEMVYDERAVGAKSEVPAIYFNLGVIYANRGRFADAVGAMREGLRLEPLRPDVLNSVGSFILRDGGDCGAAMPYFLRAADLDPSYALAWLNAGECAALAGDTASMKRYFLNYVRLDPAAARRLEIDRRIGLPPGW